MRKLTLTAIAMTLAAPALAYTPSQGVTFAEFVTARGCIVNEVKGKAGNTLYLNIVGGCPAAAQFTPVGSILVDGDNDPSTPDVWVSDN